MSSHRDNSPKDDDYDDTPLHLQRPFGAGLHKKPIAFVSASGDGQLKSVDDKPAAARPQTDVADLYLRMVLPDNDDATARSKSAPPATTTTTSSDPETQCPVCNLPLDTDAATHARSLAHQLCLPHSPPPSALDRSRMGLAYLSARGWDPDARRGLGAAQQGIRFPVKARVKDDRLGLGVAAVPRGRVGGVAGQGQGQGQGQSREEEERKRNKGQLLDAKKVRKMAVEERRRGEEIRRELFGDGRLEKYLGVGTGSGAGSASGSWSSSRSSSRGGRGF